MYAMTPPFSVSSRLNPPPFLRIHPFFSSFFSSSSSSSSSHTQPPSDSNGIVLQYLIDTFQLSPASAVSIMANRRGLKSTEKPRSVYKYLSELGLSDTQIKSAIRNTPQLAFTSIEKTLKPKIEFFQNLGLVGSHLSKFISKNSKVLSCSLEKTLMPNIEILKNVLAKDKCNAGLPTVLRRCSGILMRSPDKVLSVNISYLRSCGVVDYQLPMLLKRQPALLITRESRLKDFVSMAIKAGFSINSRMFIHGLLSISSISNATFKKKVELICSFGITEKECMRMFNSAPVLMRTSIDKLEVGLEFFMNEAKVSKSEIVRKPSCLMHAMHERVLPRYRVLEVLKSKRLTKKLPKLINSLWKSDEDFLDIYVRRFPDNMDDLFEAFRGNSVGALQPEELAT
ncbi:hypothetical protein IC582_017092 [Cucumis melo]|uniref:Transcription termination factor MTERF5, chloroplastic n=2 Tax=Cucumis melo TaxID=3656 RepID=A0A1S3BXT8_CUCME|nr:transcription termination factor MTERF5, chloroplastic [Cucumis melo]XP_008453755.2 transcription termination factor MTERF5, chloroplastic [Cucumis melo]XP_008453756.2 transcription termination factor MTERF5, chloroplastic [Cucumis melo]XP_008453758.2 transcription termination factor MTERF5, chloroplastic [Cucumis melo]XP_050943153.1 transcription termination factor MTERF5, chloroplastic [Cucumis melo]XP_050943154.1 transcription termination factor MTERF5, chloroplastic [Cucumis melo]XP_05